MYNTSLIFIALHRDQVEYYIDINKIITIEPNNDDVGTFIHTVSSDVFYCNESVSEVMKLMDEGFKSRILNTDYTRCLK